MGATASTGAPEALPSIEDMDLSLRAYLIGWHALWLHDVRTPNELPSAYAAYRKQQYRWVFGPMQLYRRCVSFIWESHLPLLHKLRAFQNLHILRQNLCTGCGF